jgi:predicted nucleic acid-binding protein
MTAAAFGTARLHAASSVAYHRLFPAMTSLLMAERRLEHSLPPLSIRLLSTVKEEKEMKKQRRKEQWEYAQKRLESLKTRRDDRPRDVKKNDFREWFDKRRIYQEIQDRKARQAKLDWTIQAAAILERLPVVTRDKPQWEIEYHNLKAYLGQFGKEYPEELGFQQNPKELVFTDEELLGMLCDLNICCFV